MTTLPITYWLDPDRYHHHYLLFLHFLVRNHWYFLFWTSTLDPECITQQCWSPPLLFFSDFSLFYICFSSRNANVSIFGNAHWTLKTVPSKHHHQPIPVFFFCFFLYFIVIFHPEKHLFPDLEVCTGPWSSTHPSPVMTTIPIFFLRFFHYFIDIFHSA